MQRRHATREGAEASSARDRGAPRRGHCRHPRARQGGDRRRRIHQSLSQARLQAAGREPHTGDRRSLRPGYARPGAQGPGRIRIGQSDRAAARGPRPPGRARRRHRGAPGSAGALGHARVLLQRRRRADRQARALGPGARAGHQAGRGRLAGGGVPRRLHRGHRARIPSPATAHAEDLEAIRRFAVAEPPRRAGRGSSGVRREIRRLLPGVEPLRRGQGGRRGQRPRRERQDLREGRRVVAAHHRLRRRQGSRRAQVRRHLHLLRAGRRLPRHQVAARLSQGDRRAGNRSPQHGDPRARGAAGARHRHTGGLSRLRAAQPGEGDARRRGSQDLQARRAPTSRCAT